jgi:hypothetical protein
MNINGLPGFGITSYRPEHGEAVDHAAILLPRYGQGLASSRRDPSENAAQTDRV